MSERVERRTYIRQPPDVLDKAEAEVRAAVGSKLVEPFVDGWIQAARAAGDTMLMHSLTQMVRPPPVVTTEKEATDIKDYHQAIARRRTEEYEQAVREGKPSRTFD